MESLIETILGRLRAGLPAHLIYTEKKKLNGDGDLVEYILRVSSPNVPNYQATILLIWTDDDTVDMTWGDNVDADFCLCDEYFEEGDADEHIELFIERIISKT